MAAFQNLDLFGSTLTNFFDHEAQQARKQSTLLWVNSVRAYLKLAPLDSLPTGIPCEPTACVIARALTAGDYVASVGGRAARVYTDYRYITFQLPDPVADFVMSFDSARYPELVVTRQ